MSKVLAPEKQPPSTPRTDFGNKVKAHQRYVGSDGRQVPGVTTILGVLAKPALIPWANRLGLQGIDSTKYVDEAAIVGGLAHHLVEAALGGSEPDLDDYTPNQLERAHAAVSTFERWRSAHDLRPIFTEHQLVSDEFRFGGTIDCYAELDGKPALLDFKTSSGLFPEHHYQVSAYWRLLKENGYDVRDVRLLRIPRSADEGLEEHVLTGKQVLHSWRIFEHCLAIYQLRKARS